MPFLKTFLEKIVTFVAVFIAGIIVWFLWGKVSVWTADSPAAMLETSRRQCLVALVAKSALGEEEMVWTLKTVENVTKGTKISPCDLLKTYELNRAPSQKPSANAIRNEDYIVEVEGRLWHRERVRKASALIERLAKGDRTIFDTQKYPDLNCVTRMINYVGPFWIDASGADEKALNREMRRVHTAPSGSKPHYFCPK